MDVPRTKGGRDKKKMERTFASLMYSCFSCTRMAYSCAAKIFNTRGPGHGGTVKEIVHDGETPYRLHRIHNTRKGDDDTARQAVDFHRSVYSSRVERSRAFKKSPNEEKLPHDFRDVYLFFINFIAAINF